MDLAHAGMRLMRLNCRGRTGILPILPEGTVIPKIIHQIFLSDPPRPLPSELLDNISKLKALNQGWRHITYNDADVLKFIKTEYGDVVFEYYNRINKKYSSARADIFRYLVLYKLGGVYLDLKSSMTKPMDEIIVPGDCFILSHWKLDDNQTYRWGVHPELNAVGGREFQQWHIIAAPGHPFLRNVIEHVFHNIDHYIPPLHGVGRNGVLRVTGPIAYTLAIAPLLGQCRYRVVESHYDLGLIYSIYENIHHQTVLGAHYSYLTDSVVNIGITRKAISLFYIIVRFVYKYFFRKKKIRQHQFG
jgi:inositol phosphorylceramide mannosyltransferase catalytic subunit